MVTRIVSVLTCLLLVILAASVQSGPISNGGVSLGGSGISGTLPIANGGTNLTASADDNVMVGNGTTWQTKALADCQDSAGNHLNYTASTNAFSCGTSDLHAGTVTSVATGFGLTGGAITSTGTVSHVAPGADDQVYVSDSTSAATWRSLPDCTDSAGNHLNYTAASNAFSCGTSGVAPTTLGAITAVNGISTVSGGVPAEVATVDLTAQVAAIAATTAYAVPAGGVGMYRISYVAKVTTVAGTSSVLGGANGFQVKYTDATDSVVTTTAGGLFVSSLNTTQAQINGSIVVYAKASSNIQYSIGYTSVPGAGADMAYNLHVKIEAM